MSNNTAASNTTISIISPGDHDQLQECNAVTIIWQGGVMPYNMTITASNPGGLPSSQHVDGIQTNELTWTVNESPGVSVDIFVTDDDQNVVMAGPFVVAAGTDCPIAPSSSSIVSSPISPPSLLLITSSSQSTTSSSLISNSSSSSLSSSSAVHSTSSSAPAITPVIPPPRSSTTSSTITSSVSTSVSSPATVGPTSESIATSTPLDAQLGSSWSISSTAVTTTSSVLGAVLTPQATSGDEGPAARSSSHTTIIIGTVIAGFFVIALIISAIIIRRRSRRPVIAVTSEGLAFMGELDGGSSATLVTRQMEQHREGPTHQRSSTARPVSQSTFTHTTSSEMGKPEADTSIQNPQATSGSSSAENHTSLGIPPAEQARFSNMSRRIYPDSMHDEEPLRQSYPQYATYVREQDGGVRLAGGPLSGGSHFVEDLSEVYQVTLPPAYGDL